MSLSVDLEKDLGSFRLRAAFEAKDETLALLGASGCGKSLTLRCIAGIEKPDRGRIVVDGITLFDSEKGVNLTPQQRRTGLMFQNDALFPNMTVLQNIRAGARRERDALRREQGVAEVMESFGLTELAGRYPAQLSGGQQQRVALARILVSGPRILLLDEPFSALDSHLRFRLEQEVRQVLHRFGRTVVLVSHDRDEVFRMSDSIVIMDDGQIQTAGSRDDVFRDPRTRSGAVLTGCKNISRVCRLDGARVRALDWGITLELREKLTDEKYLGIRMHDVRPGDGENAFWARVTEEIENPFSFTVMLRPEEAEEKSTPIGWEMEKDTWRRLRADRVKISLPPESILRLRE